MSDPVYGLMTSLRTHLVDKMISNVPTEYVGMLAYVDRNQETQTLRPSLIKIGRLQDDPTRLATSTALPSTHISIHTGDPDDLGDGWVHAVATGTRAQADLHMRIPPYEVGGGKRWWRRLKISFRVFFIKSNQDEVEASRLGNLFRGLLETYCESKSLANAHGWPVGGLQLGFGESALTCEVARSYVVAGGGPPANYIYEGDVWLQVLTSRE